MMCSHGEMVRREGSKNGKPWVGYFCPTPKGTPNQCAPQFEKTATVPKYFGSAAPKAEPAHEEQTKDETITRIAIAKSMIESGKPFNIETVKEADKWLNWVQGRVASLAPADPQDVKAMPW